MKLPFKFLVTLGTSHEISFWSRNRNGAFPRISFTTKQIFPMNILKYSLLLFIMPCWYFQINECTKKSRNSRGKTRAMESHFYTMDCFVSLTRFFLYTFRKIPYNFSLCPVRISRKMNAKKSRNSRGRQKEWNPTCTTLFFFLSREFSYILQEYIHVEVCFSKNGDTYSPNYKRTTEQ